MAARDPVTGRLLPAGVQVVGNDLIFLSPTGRPLSAEKQARLARGFREPERVVPLSQRPRGEFTDQEYYRAWRFGMRTGGRGVKGARRLLGMGPTEDEEEEELYGEAIRRIGFVGASGSGWQLLEVGLKTWWGRN